MTVPGPPWDWEIKQTATGWDVRELGGDRSASFKTQTQAETYVSRKAIPDAAVRIIYFDGPVVGYRASQITDSTDDYGEFGAL